MRYLFGSVFVCVLGAALLAGCSESGSGAGAPGVYCVGNVCPCTEAGIRGAIEAGGPDAYRFDCDGPQTVVAHAGIFIDKGVILDGEGNLTVTGDGDDSVFRVAAEVRAELRDFGVAATGSPGSAQYGFRNAGTLVLDGCTVSEFGEFGIVNGVFPDSSDSPGGLTLRNSTVSGNAGGILNDLGSQMELENSTVSGNDDIGIRNEATLTLTNTTVSGNTGGGIVNGTMENGAVDSEGEGAAGTLTLTNSTVSDNGAGGIANLVGMLTATNSTVSGNEGPGIRNAATAALTSSTVSGNAEEGIVTVGEGAETMLRQSLIDDECGGDDGIISNGYNIESPGNTCGLEAVIDDLKLGALTDNGGPTNTHALEPGSPAINQIPQEDCIDADNASLTTDQRGRPRPETGGSMCDVGSFEAQ